jgi:hypothetical protein
MSNQSNSNIVAFAIITDNGVMAFPTLDDLLNYYYNQDETEVVEDTQMQLESIQEMGRDKDILDIISRLDPPTEPKENQPPTKSDYQRLDITKIKPFRGLS